MNEVPVKHLHPSRTRSSEFNKIVGKFRLGGPSEGLQSKYKAFLNLGSENIHRPAAVFPDNMKQCLSVLTEKEVCLTSSLNLTSFKLFLFSPKHYCEEPDTINCILQICPSLICFPPDCVISNFSLISGLVTCPCSVPRGPFCAFLQPT